MDVFVLTTYFSVRNHIGVVRQESTTQSATNHTVNRCLPSGFRPVVSWQLIPPLAAKIPSAALLGSCG